MGRFNEQTLDKGSGAKANNDKSSELANVLEYLQKGKRIEEKPKLIISSSRKNELLKQSRLYL